MKLKFEIPAQLQDELRAQRAAAKDALDTLAAEAAQPAKIRADEAAIREELEAAQSGADYSASAAARITELRQRLELCERAIAGAEEVVAGHTSARSRIFSACYEMRAEALREIEGQVLEVILAAVRPWYADEAAGRKTAVETETFRSVRHLGAIRNSTWHLMNTEESIRRIMDDLDHLASGEMPGCVVFNPAPQPDSSGPPRN